MEINTICKGYREYNEDLVIVIKDHLFIVIDSATGLTDPIYPPSDGVFLLKDLKEELLNSYNEGKLKGSNFVKKMNQISTKIYRKFIKGKKDKLERYEFPHASISVCLIEQVNVHFFSIGDTSTFIKFKNGKARYISDKSMPLMDKKTCAKYYSKGITDFESMKEELRYNRSLLNKNGKRSCFSLYKKPKLKFKHELYDIRDLFEVYLCSDGYYEAFETFKLFKSRRALFASNSYLQDVYKKIQLAVKSDLDKKIYPRIKVQDDISAIKIMF